jgi:hypothetical protein
MTRFAVKNLVPLGWVLAASTAWGQAPGAEAVKMTEFPAAASMPTAQELADKLSGKVWRAPFANGAAARYDFRGQYLFVNLSSGASDNGRWRAEDGRMCVEFRGRFPSGCTEVRLHGGKPVFQRAATGELVTMHAD